MLAPCKYVTGRILSFFFLKSLIRSRIASHINASMIWYEICEHIKEQHINMPKITNRNEVTQRHKLGLTRYPAWCLTRDSGWGNSLVGLGTTRRLVMETVTSLPDYIILWWGLKHHEDENIEINEERLTSKASWRTRESALSAPQLRACVL